MNKPANKLSIQTTGGQDLQLADNAELQQQLDLFIKQVGERVLTVRQSLGMSRRVLAEVSGVSQRTIVLLEGGRGNISISLLFRIARALGHSVQWFILPDERTHQDSMRVADFYLTATPAQQQQVLNIIASQDQNALKKRRVCLIGLRGAGKSTLGRKVSETCSTPFRELNSEIEMIVGMSVQETMNLYGQEGYRRLEFQALEEIVSSTDNVILAAAGGVVSDPQTFAYLLKHFHTVWLKATPEEHMQRVRDQGDHRPMAGNPEAMSQLRSLLVNREALYASADVQLDTSGKAIEDSLNDLNEVVRPLLDE